MRRYMNSSTSFLWKIQKYHTQEAGEFPRTRGEAEFTFDTI
jgi:hypothetical protein